MEESRLAKKDSRREVAELWLFLRVLSCIRMRRTPTSVGRFCRSGRIDFMAREPSSLWDLAAALMTDRVFIDAESEGWCSEETMAEVDLEAPSNLLA